MYLNILPLFWPFYREVRTWIEQIYRKTITIYTVPDTLSVPSRKAWRDIFNMAAPIELLTCRSTHASLRRLCPLDLRLVCWLRSWRQPWSCDRYSGTDLPYLPTGTKFYHTFPRPYTSVRPTPRLRSGEPQLQLWPWPTTLTRATDTRLTTTVASAAWPTTSQHCQQHHIYSASRFHAQSNQTGLTVMTPLIKGRAIGIAVRVSPWAWSKPSERHLSLTSTSSEKRKLVLGIETSCDDTGAAVVDQYGAVLGESLISQTRIHVELVLSRTNKHWNSVTQQIYHTVLILYDIQYTRLCDISLHGQPAFVVLCHGARLDGGGGWDCGQHHSNVTWRYSLQWVICIRQPMIFYMQYFTSFYEIMFQCTETYVYV